MDIFDSGLGGIILGWVLAQLGFFIQRRRLLKGEVSKAAYFLLIVLNEVATLAAIKKNPKFDSGVCDRYYNIVLGKDSFHTELASACEKVAMVSVEMARRIRKSCILADQAAQSSVEEIRNLSPTLSDMSSEMFVEILKSEHYQLEQLVFHLLRSCDYPYFFRFCKDIGWKKSIEHMFRKKSKPGLTIEEVKTILDDSCQLAQKLKEHQARN